MLTRVRAVLLGAVAGAASVLSTRPATDGKSLAAAVFAYRGETASEAPEPDGGGNWPL